MSETITARLTALQLAFSMCKEFDFDSSEEAQKSVVGVAKEFYQFIIGDFSV